MLESSASPPAPQLTTHRSTLRRPQVSGSCRCWLRSLVVETLIHALHHTKQLGLDSVEDSARRTLATFRNACFRFVSFGLHHTCVSVPRSRPHWAHRASLDDLGTLGRGAEPGSATTRDRVGWKIQQRCQRHVLCTGPQDSSSDDGWGRSFNSHLANRVFRGRLSLLAANSELPSPWMRFRRSGPRPLGRA